MENDNPEGISLKKIENEKIYRRLTINMQNKMAKFRDGRSKKDNLNTQLIINISSLCKFLRKNELEKIKEEEESIIRKNKKEELENELEKIKKKMLEQEKLDKKKEKEKAKNKNKNELNTKKLSEEMQKLKKEKSEIEDKIKQIEKEETEKSNSTILDVFVPYSRLTQFVKNKLESVNEEIAEEEDEGDDNLNFEGEQFDLNNSLEKNKFSDLVANEDADDDLNANANTEFLANDNMSISQSFYQKPIGFDEFNFNNNDNELKLQKDSFSDKELVKHTKTKEVVMPEINKEEELKNANEEFKNFLKPKEIKELVYDMSYDYIKYMKILYDKMKAKSEENINESNSQSKTLNFINQFKSFILDIGISDKKFYEQCIREIIYNKSELEFGEFLNCFKKLLNLKFDQIYLKYKFLLNIVEREDDEYFSDEELEKYFYLIYNCKKLNENEIQEEIRSKLLKKYRIYFPKSDKKYTRKLSLVLEQFFDIK